VRQLGLQFRQEGRIIKVSGYIDEFVDYSPLLACPPPLRLNLRHIVAANSIGIRKWLDFIQAWGQRPLELHECPELFIELANFMPIAVSSNGNMKRIKSVIIPFRCDSCNATHEMTVPTDEVTVDGDDIALPLRQCPKCARTLASDIDLQDHFLFLAVK
jgi:hypothetical protein